MNIPHLCLVIGVGEGTGASIVRRFVTAGAHVVMVARSGDTMTTLAGEYGNQVTKIQCDMSDAEGVERMWQRVLDDFGLPDSVIYNAVSGSFGGYETLTRDTLQSNLQTNYISLVEFSQRAVPEMVKRGHGAFVATGNTSAYRGKPLFAGFAPSKAAQRIYLEALARDVWPRGVHVGYIAVDAVIDLPWMRERFPGKPDQFFCKPDDIAQNIYNMICQPKSAWSFDLTIRPFCEDW